MTAVIAKPFGAPAEGDESDEGSQVESDEDEEKRGDEKREKKERDGVVDPRFHKQESKSPCSFTSKSQYLFSSNVGSTARDGEDAENTIFLSPRGKLFAFTEGKWKERGTGIFKLNILHPSSEAKEENLRPTARFIMRAQLTHRLILNMPLFKEMDFKEPQGGKLTFSAMQDGLLVGHVLRVSKAISVLIALAINLTFNRSKRKKHERFIGSLNEYRLSYEMHSFVTYVMDSFASRFYS